LWEKKVFEMEKENTDQIDILIVEDDRSSAALLKKIITDCGYSIAGVAQTGEESYSIVDKFHPDLVLMDISLNGPIDGVEAAEHIYKNFNIPFVFITACTDELTLERVKKSMPFGYILKPFNKNFLKTTIDMALYRYKTEVELSKYRAGLEKMVLERTEELTKANENLVIYSHAVNQSPTLILIINRENRVVYANRKFAEVSGYDGEQIIGADVSEYGNPVISEPEVWEKMISADRWHGEMYHVSKNNEIYYLNAYVTSILKKNGEVTAYLIVADDITDEKKISLELEKVRETLDKSQIEMLDLELDWQKWKEKMLDRNMNGVDRSIFRNIHSSFTQGAGFGSLVTLLEMMSVSAEIKDGKYLIDSGLFGLIQKNVDSAKHALKMFANIDRVISNDFELKKTSVYDVFNYLKLVIKDVSALRQIKNHKIAMNDFNHGFRGFSVNINREYAYLAFFEMLINAMKFSRNDSHIIVLLKIVNRSLRISVTNEPLGNDDITGIPEEYSRAVFEPFYRLSKLVFEEYKTLDFGLGLTLIEKVVNRHGGEVFAGNIVDHTDLRDDPQLRVNFTVSIPLADL